MYYCNHCGEVFEEPKIVMGDRGDLSYGEIQVCPECESENFEQE